MQNWILIAESSAAKIFSVNPRFPKLELVREFVNPRGRLHRADLVTSAPGRVYKNAGNVASAADPRTDPHDAELNQFVRKIAVELDHARARNDFEKLGIIAAPHLLGLLREAIDARTQKRLTACADKNCTTTDLAVLQHELQEELPELFWQSN